MKYLFTILFVVNAVSLSAQRVYTFKNNNIQVRFDPTTGLMDTVVSYQHMDTGRNAASLINGRILNKVRDSVQSNIPTNNNQLTNGAGFITGNQNITLSGDISGTGTTDITTAIGAGKVTNTMLAGSIDLTTKVTSVLSVANGGTGSTTLPNATYYTAYGTGTAYTLTATSAFVDFGTNDPTITIATAGTYLIMYDVQTNYSGATFAASRTITYKLRRTNNTAADLTNGSISFNTQVITALSFSPTQKTRHLIYTASAGDVIQLWGNVSVLPTAGSVQANDASIVAIRLF